MGMIVSFIPRREQRCRPWQTQNGAASVIIFPGVRYEKLTSPMPRAGEAAPAGISPDTRTPRAKYSDDWG